MHLPSRRLCSIQVLALVFAISQPSLAQSCEVARARPSTCLMLEYVRALALMAQAEEGARSESAKDSDAVESGFYAIKSRLHAESRISYMLEPYRHSREPKTARAAK